MSPRGASTPFGTAPRTRPYRISAIFELGMSEYDRSMLFMPLPEAQRYFSKPDRVDVLELVVDDPEAIDQRIVAMKAAIDAPLHYASWRDRNETFFTVLEVERTVMFIILALIILVAAFNIASSLIMMVMEKTKDIGINFKLCRGRLSL